MFYRVQGVVTPDGMVPIPAGTFTMGDVSDTNLNGDAAPTVISVSGFYMDQNLVSFSQWQGVYSYATNQGYSFADPGLGQAANHPVQSVDWFDCVKWSNARSRQTGLTPVYYTDAGFTQVFTNGDSGATIYANWSANGYRLPTEAEWELAARGGLSGQRFPWGNTISWSQANYYGDPLSVDTNNGFFYDLATAKDYDPAFSGGDNGNIPYTSPVGSFPSNNYGLNDMAGNVFEWCWDWYGTPYGLPTTTNPTGPATGGVRVLRGGSWGFNAISARCANRGVNPPSNSPSYFGFRCVKGL
jgi:formylglycine-generating enzyme required for sulfatase activity